MIGKLRGALDSVKAELPRWGTAGSRSAQLHAEATGAQAGDIRYDLIPQTPEEQLHTTVPETRTFFILRWAGTVGSLLIAGGALGAGALPVVGNPYDDVPFGSLMSRMLQTSSALVMVGVGLLVTAWIFLAPFVGTPLRQARRGEAASARYRRLVSPRQLWITWAGWIIPLILTAPLFTQDIYSYLANGSIVAQGMDPYSAGPVQLLGADNELARSVPFIWANSPSPYGPVALGLAGVVSIITGNSIILGVIAHRLLSIVGIIVAGWAITQLARRCRVSPASALWLGILNPLTILHLVGGIHNESLMLGLSLLGMELGLRGIDKLGHDKKGAYLLLFTAGFFLSCAGMVKVTGFIGLGFTGMAYARHLHVQAQVARWKAVLTAIAVQGLVLVVTIAVISVITGINLGWVTGQGGAATIRSWLSLSTAIGVGTGFLGMFLGLGDHTDAILTITRSFGVFVAFAFMVRMLFATLRGYIHPVGGLGISTLVLVIFFPVVHPWYILWAVLPLAAWANRHIFRFSVVAYTGAMSFFVLPRGLGLPAGTVLSIYIAAACAFAVIAGLWWVAMYRNGIRILN
ncbi:alpha 1,6 mannopyranosyltransferase [Corynebacterium macginleyi]|uniref:Polyprenol phosphomannose-dependent alpha 1,6 mannosyltransferase MptB n=1 Tax=Corynebacterium macginleyi TaxID=38290 RepID=A0ABS1Y617_9CORY|nr:polyprenol phosphomannose-dependent alpha 1,6 mannosyltransferase MptB [Corynebacterium macginleyi]MBK4140973.1 alpha 1,6 mannopyranosyltransferase [Corynebacterium macginleyi]MBK4145648.1 alpha 1,6 mannopyranosyltransferase [Corynebacterium macginleyi]MBK4161309.1 alpha 1,6 mannopyranosyltransferase [Corynebacterium macginleyi]MBK4164058.1 alpha 1,6 mannopyranosyltransferase [Corynebacterium macginleyi]MBK4166662.1 alpha 1,6 mannopyranosyltransferase [Corynebacterium macginleyi]